MKSLLPPGPWDSRGNKVIVANGQTVCVVFYPRNAGEIARMIAQLPEIIEERDELKEQLDAMQPVEDEEIFDE